MIGVVVSRADRASVHVGERLRSEAQWEVCESSDRPDGEGGGAYYVRDGFELREFDELHLHLDGVADAFDDPNLVVFVSRHAGETGPLLTAHFTGNVGTAEYGGQPNQLARACPNALDSVLEVLSEHAPDGYDVGMECTHHGPSRIGAPSMFVEVGSAEEQWQDPSAATAVARAVLDLAGAEPDLERTVVGFGGGHYAPRFHRIVRETDWAVGHVVADWALGSTDGLDSDVIDQVFEESVATRAVVDGDRQGLIESIREAGYRIVSETWIRETEGVPLDVVERAEELLCSIDDGLRFGDRRATDLVTESINPDLVHAAVGVDDETIRRGIERHVVAYETEEGGNRPTGRMCLPVGDSLDPVITSISDVLRAGGASVDREGDEILVSETVFEPERAREQGVTDGPAFGQLAGGESVDIDGERVTPESVHTRRTRRYQIYDERP